MLKSAGKRKRRARAPRKAPTSRHGPAKKRARQKRRVRANSKQEAIEQVKNFLKVAGDGETEIREIFEGPGPCGDNDSSEKVHELLENAWS